MKELNSFNDDLLERKQIAINLTNILKCKDNLNVLAIDSSWGTGKTTFINMWIDMLKNTNEFNSEFETMYFNAWENDYIKDSLISLLTEINNQIKDKEGKTNSFLEKTKPYAKIGSEIILKYLTKGVIDNFKIDNASIENGLTELSEQIGKYKINEIVAAKNSRIAFKKNLKEFQSFINKKVIIFVDELDRCKPTYAIQLLETIKHIFNLDNYIFVISLDKEQLSYSIKTLYGQEMDSEGYLRRFFDLEYHLPFNPTNKYIMKKNSSLPKNPNIIYLTTLIEQIFLLENYSLRDINKIYEYINLSIPNIDFFNGQKTCADIYVYVGSLLYCYFFNLKIKHSKIYNDILHFSYTPTIEYINNNLLTFNLENLNLNIPVTFDQKPAKELLKDVIPLYLILLHKSCNNKNYTISPYEADKFKVSIKSQNELFNRNEVNLLSFIKYDNIINTLEFVNNFTLQ